MKNILKIAILSLVLTIFLSCDKHDRMDDLVFVGEMAPHVQWSIASTTVTAGTDVTFNADYYTTAESPISHLEVWYNIRETESKNVQAPWVVSTPYLVASEKEVEKRISQLIKTYEHNESNWNGDERAYKFSAVFPTSNTLSRVAWGGAEYDEEKVEAAFGATFMQNYKDSLYNYLHSNPDKAYKDFESLVKTDSIWQADYFKPYVTESFDENSQTTYKHFVDHKIPQPLDSLYKTFTFKDIISNEKGDLSISYSRSYKLSAQLRCLDEKGTAGLSIVNEITLN